MSTNPSARPAIAVIHTTATDTSAATDDKVKLTVQYDASSRPSETFDLTLPNYDMRVAGRTDICVFALAATTAIATDIDRIELKLEGTNGWLVKHLWVVFLGPGSDKQLLLALPNWNTWLDDASGRSLRHSWPVPRFEPPSDNKARLFLNYRTADVTDAGSDGKIYLDIRSSGGNMRQSLSKEWDQRERLRSEEFEYTDSAETPIAAILSTLQPGEVFLDNRTSASGSGWLPDYLFLIGFHPNWNSTNKGFRLLGCPDPWTASTFKHDGWFDREACAAHSINWLGPNRLLAGPILTFTRMSAGKLTESQRTSLKVTYPPDKEVLLALVWVWSIKGQNPAPFSVELTMNGVTSKPGFTGIKNLNKDYGFIQCYAMTGFKAEDSGTLRVKLYNNTVSIDMPFKAPAAQSTTGRVRIAFGSCVDTARNDSCAEALHHMSTREADLAILGGDNSYYVQGNDTSGDSSSADWASTSNRMRRMLAGHSRPELKSLLRQLPIYATWDDHDFGKDDACGRDMFGGVKSDRDTAASVFRFVWPGPYEHNLFDLQKTVEDAPIYGRLRQGPVDIILTDSRYERWTENPLASANPQGFFGDAQREWLVSAITNNTAPVIVLVVASPFLKSHKGDGVRCPSSKKGTDSYCEWCHLYDAMDARIASSPTTKILVLSGDVHYSQLRTVYPEIAAEWTHLRKSTGDYALSVMEVTSSPIQKKDGGDYGETNTTKGRLGIYFRKQSFAFVDIDVQATTSTITVTYYKDDGSKLDQAIWTTYVTRNNEPVVPSS